MDVCIKEITGYLSKTQQISKQIPYGSKYFGMAFIPEDQQWPTCQNCQREMVLILQLLASDFPEPQEGFIEGDMLQVFTCAYIEPRSGPKSDAYGSVDPRWDSPTWNECTKRPKVLENQKCYNWQPKEHTNNRNVVLTGSNAAEYDRIESTHWETVDHTPKTQNASSKITLSQINEELRYIPRVINIKNKKPKLYQAPPWIEAYHLELKADGTLIDKLPKHQINNEILDYIYWVKSRLHFFKYYLSNPSYALQIRGWEKYSYICHQSVKAHDIFNGCFGSEIPDVRPSDFSGLGFLGALTISEDTLIERNEISTYPMCECCDKPMKLFFSFGTSWEPTYGWASQEPVKGIFYCGKGGDFQISCIDSRK